MKLLIVDDEARTRDMLLAEIEWSTIGISEVQTARNGLHALEVTSDWEPDIILCDIRMPKMDGIEFAQNYREAGGKGKLIFLSGYSDKEYLKAAIKMQALNYLEKPINPPEVLETVAAAVREKTSEEAKRFADRQLRKGVDRSLPFLRQEMVRRLIKDPDAEHVRQALENRDVFLIPSEGMYTVMSVAMFWRPGRLPEEPSIVQEYVLQKLSESSLYTAYHAICGFDPNNLLVIILPGIYRSSYREGRVTVEELTGELTEMLDSDITFRVGIGEPVRRLSDIPACYRRAVDAGSSLFYDEGRRICFEETMIESRPFTMDRQELHLFREELRRGDIPSAEQRIRLFEESISQSRDLDIIRIQDLYFQHIIIIIETAFQQGTTDQEEEGERRYIWKELDRMMSLRQLTDYLLSFLGLLQEKPQHGSGKIRQIVRYIHAHFHERGFTIHAIAEHVGMNDTYLSVYFKKQKGKTIKEYTNEVRCEQAKRLLAETDIKLYEVASKLGFADVNYFTTFFKKTVGCTPSEYRDRNGR